MFMSASILAQLKIPNLSSTATFSQDIGLTTVEVAYSRPSKKNRKIFNGILPYGQYWRTGANIATKFSFSKSIIINGKLLEKGNYTLLTIPEKSSWKVKWYVYESTNWNNYKEKTPIISFDIPVQRIQETIETFSMSFQNVTLQSADLFIEWENTRIVIPFEVSEHEEIIKSIDKSLSGPSTSEYFRAALYYHETKTDLQKALTYIQKVTSSDNALFFQVTREVLILQDLSKNKEALLVAKRALELSKKAKNKDFIKINSDIISALSK